MRRACSAALVMLSSFVADMPAPASGALVHQPLSRYAVVIVLDGARPNYLTLSHLPHFQWLRRQGILYTRAIAGQEIANTPPAHATIGTGLFPSHHGVQGFVWKDPVSGAAIRPADTPQVLRGDLERILDSHHVPSLSSALKKQDPHARIVSISGHKCYAADAMGTPAADYILCSLIYHDRWVAQAVTGHRPPPGALNNSRFDVPIPNPRSGFGPAVEQWNLGDENRWVVRYALWAFHRVHFPRLMMINLPETDVTGHFAAEWQGVEGTLMRQFDAELGQIITAYRGAGILQRTDFVVTSDHGMSRISQRVPFSLFDHAISDAGATKLYVEGDTAAAIGIRESNKSVQVGNRLAELVRQGSVPIDAVYYKMRRGTAWLYRAAFTAKGVSPALDAAYRTLLNTSAARESADVVAVYAPHVTTGDRPAGKYHWVAGHLGPQWDDQHIPLLIAGPGVRHNVTSPYPARLVDIAPTVESLLAVQGGETDGVVLADAFTHASAREKTAQRRMSSSLIRLVNVLQRRSTSH